MKPGDSPGATHCDRTNHDKSRDERAKQRAEAKAKAEAKPKEKAAEEKPTEVAKKSPNLMDKARTMLKGPSGE